ncbi:MAG: hypothetical protein FJY29_01015 [Betaproteobacteria bacterium]|nr:hypothetical protein [Betaproteobacteria bacterium]
MPRDNKPTPDQSWISREDLQDIAKIGGDILKRTVSSSIDVIKDVTDTLPKDASQIINKSREEMMKGLSREFAQNLVSLAVEKMFAAVRDHRLDISIRVRKATDTGSADTHAQTAQAHESSESLGQRNHTDGRASHRPGYQPEAQSHTQPRKNPPHRHRP